MIAYIKGIVAKAKAPEAVIENNGIGYKMLLPNPDCDSLMNSVGQEVKVHTYMSVREDDVSLFGFLTEEELDFFKLLINVSGIGPKGALGILSSMTVSELRYAILADDARTISRAPGIGAKTAGKLVLELKDKVKLDDLLPVEKRETKKAPEDMAASDATEALIALGYSAATALKAVNAAKSLGITDVEGLIKAALKQL